MSTKNAWYFDHGFWGITQYYQWRTVYSNRIPRKRGVLGGEACVWTELIDGDSLGMFICLIKSQSYTVIRHNMIFLRIQKEYSML